MTNWLEVFELTIVLTCTFYGSIMNAGFIGAFKVNRNLNRKDYTYLIALGFTDISITSFVMPFNAILMINNLALRQDMCNIMQLITSISTSSHSLLTMFVAADSYFYAHPDCPMKSVLRAIPASIAIPFIVLISTVIEIVGTYLNLRYDFCDIDQEGNLLYRIATNIFVHVLPAVISMRAFINVANIAPVTITVRGPMDPEERLNYTIPELNIITYSIYLCCWAPCLMTIYIKPDMSGFLYYYVIWIGLIRAAIGNSLYIIFNKYCRRGFTLIFKYFCCPTAIGFIDHPPVETQSDSEEFHEMQPPRIAEHSV